tara:strand:+ start:676 stop:981 length:306 start_codon:yes stop_codon:yes gene_type:complete
VKWCLVNKFDEIVDTCEIASGVGVSGAKTYFRKIKELDEQAFDKLWKVMSKTEYDRTFKNSLQNRQMGKMKYEWWREEETYLDIEAPITQSEDNNGRKTEG